MPQFKILLVEDDDTVASLIRFLVEKQGHTLHHARDGREGLAMLDATRPDAVILDLLLPYIDGLSVLRSIRGHAEQSRTPVLVLTGRTQAEDIAHVLDSGASDYLAKPFRPAELTARLDRLLRTLS